MKFHGRLIKKGERKMSYSICRSFTYFGKRRRFIQPRVFNFILHVLMLIFRCGFPFKYKFSMSAIRRNSFGNACHNKTISGQTSLDKTHQLLAVGFGPEHPTTLMTTSFFCNKEKHVDIVAVVVVVTKTGFLPACPFLPVITTQSF